MKVLKNVVVTIVGIVFVLGLAVFGTQIYFKKKHNIDLFATVANFKTMSQEVDEGKLFPNVYTEDDKAKTKESADSSIEGLVKYENEKYSINLDGLTTMKKEMDFSDRQLAFFAQLMVEKQMDGKLKISESTTLVFEVRQIKISDVKTDGSATFNVVVKFDLSTVKDKMTDFPMSFIKKYVPDYLYVSSTVDVEKESGKAFSYTVKSKELTFNNLTSEETKTTFETLDYFLKVGSADSLNTQIGETVMNVLVGVEGDANKQGLAVSLKSAEASGYEFREVEGVGHFVITTNNGTEGNA